MFQIKKQHHAKLPADPDEAAAFTLADLSAPDGTYRPDRVHADYKARMADAGIVFDEDGFNEQGFLLRRLTARAMILETAWMQIMRKLSDVTLTGKDTGYFIRGASRLQEDLEKTYGLILKIRKAQGEDPAPFLTDKDRAIADDHRVHSLSISPFRLSIPQLVEAEMQGEKVASAESLRNDTRPVSDSTTD